jgi:hypothetical protein
VLLPVVRATTDLPTGAAHQHEHQARDQQDEADRPQDRNREQKTEQHEYDTECDHVLTFPHLPRSPTEQIIERV